MKKIVPEEFQDYLDERDQSRPQERAASAVTVRGIGVGCLLCLVIAIGAPYTTMLLKGTPMGFSSSTPAAFFLLFVTMVTVHLLLGLCRASWALTRGELLTITLMMMVATAIPTRGVTGMVLPMITGTYYYASEENDWAALLYPHMRDWYLVKDAAAVRDFYEGNPGGGIPWDAWLPALMSWFLFYAAFFLALVCIMVILRKQWVEHERLPFPMAQVPLAMFEGGGGNSVLGPFFKNWVMWLGFSLPAFISSLTALQHYYPAVPNILLVFPLNVAPGLQLRFGINFVMVGFAYFINSTISFSLWIFYLYFELQQYVLGEIGVKVVQANLGFWSDAVTGPQSFGALTVLVLWGVWLGRRHIKMVWRQAVGGAAGEDDDNEIMSYRAAMFGALAGVGGMSAWLWQAGFPVLIAPIVVFIALIILLGLTRAVAEGGVPILSPAIVPAGVLVSHIGVPVLGTAGTIAAGYTLIWVGELLVFMMAPLANGLRLGSEVSNGRRRLFWAMVVAILVTLVASVWFTLHLAYKFGGVNLSGQFFGPSFPTYPSRFAVQQLKDMIGPSVGGWLWTLMGGVSMGLLLFARQRLTYWPLHPLGFAVSAGWTMGVIWSSIFLAWALKGLILKYGGASVYQKTKPFFMGMVLGQFTIGGLWLVIDALTGTVGNVIPVLY